ncbi:hypothetical protein MJM59_28280, partial [Salmonella enterica subsp. enterica serovar Montevideo]|nr:hypothetical protein [Salmonella enterica subsp. enterica serovar Montevideo]
YAIGEGFSVGGAITTSKRTADQNNTTDARLYGNGDRATVYTGKEIEQLVRHIQEHGPVRSADFEHARKGVSGWWEWKPHKRHLEG